MKLMNRLDFLYKVHRNHFSREAGINRKLHLWFLLFIEGNAADIIVPVTASYSFITGLSRQGRLVYVHILVRTSLWGLWGFGRQDKLPTTAVKDQSNVCADIFGSRTAALCFVSDDRCSSHIASDCYQLLQWTSVSESAQRTCESSASHHTIPKSRTCCNETLIS